MTSLTLVKRAEGNEGYKLRLSVSPEVLLKRNTSKKCQNVTELNATLTPQRERERERLEWVMHSLLRRSSGGVETVTQHNALFTWKFTLRRPTVGCLQAISLHAMLCLVMIQNFHPAIFEPSNGSEWTSWSWKQHMVIFLEMYAQYRGS